MSGQKNTAAKYLIMEVLKHKYSNNMAPCNFIMNISKETAWFLILVF